MKNMNKVILNSLLGGVIAMGFGTTGAYADNADEKATTGQAAATESTVAAAAIANEATPALVPGDLFYFLKVFVEKIEVVLMDNDIGKAKLLALQVEERVNEAAALFAEGKTDLAMETLNKALQTQDQAVVTVIDTKVAAEAAEKAEAGVESTEAVATQGASATDNAHADDDEDADEDEDEDEDADHEKFEAQLRHNIEALTKALEHVKNPTARAALARNIEKTLAKALKAEESSEKADDAKASVEIKIVGSDKEQATDDDQAGEQTIAAEKAAREQAKAAEKAAHEKAKAEKKAAHEQAKAEKKAAHEQAKAERKQAEK